MDDFRTLIQLLERELDNQTKLLKLLADEQVAIVSVNQEQIEAINVNKESLLEEARYLEQERSAVIERIVPPGKKQTKFTDILESCSTGPTKLRLEAVGTELKKTVHSVRELNQLNGDLIRQSLGIVNSALAIICSTPGNDLPTYGKSGALRTSEDSGRKRTTV